MRATTAAAALLGAAMLAHGAAWAQPAVPDRYMSILTGSQEVPPVPTRALSLASVQFTADDRFFVGLRLNLGHDEAVDRVHVHRGPAGTNGPIILQMRPQEAPGEGICIDLLGGLLTYYLLTELALRDDLQGMTLTELKNEMASGDTYINLHTPQHPGGWIRGQMMPVAVP